MTNFNPESHGPELTPEELAKLAAIKQDVGELATYAAGAAPSAYTSTPEDTDKVRSLFDLRDRVTGLPISKAEAETFIANMDDIDQTLHGGDR